MSADEVKYFLQGMHKGRRCFKFLTIILTINLSNFVFRRCMSNATHDLLLYLQSVQLDKFPEVHGMGLSTSCFIFWMQ